MKNIFTVISILASCLLSQGCSEIIEGQKSIAAKNPADTEEVTLQQNKNQNVESTTQIAYNIKKDIQFNKNTYLNNIKLSVIDNAKQKKLDTSNLSITLIDLKGSGITDYKENTLRYPASVVKLFWMAGFYAQLNEGLIEDLPHYQNNLYDMMVKSDNEAASFILDTLTNTYSGDTQKDYQSWLNQRQSINVFFQTAGYKDININQKTYPIPYLREYGAEPKGYELRMRGDPDNPLRNRVSTHQTARLMYDIVLEQSVSPTYSQQMQNLLKRDLSSNKWRLIDPDREFNPVNAFFGEGLPANVRFLSKAGWTSKSRQEVAYIEDNDVSFILVCFGEGADYSNNRKFFPEVSKLVFEQMKTHAQQSK